MRWGADALMQGGGRRSRCFPFDGMDGCKSLVGFRSSLAARAVGDEEEAMVSAMPVTHPAGAQQRFAPLTNVEKIPLPEYSLAATHHPGGRCLSGAQVSGKRLMPLPARYPQQHIQQCGIGPEPAEPLAQAIKADEAALLPKLQGLGKVSAG